MSQLEDATKQALCLAAVGAVLHNLGKINAKFLDKQINQANNGYLYQHILGLIAPHVTKLPDDQKSSFDTNKLNASAVLDSNTVTALKTAFKLPKPLDDRNDYTIGDLIEYLGQGELWYEEDNGIYGIEQPFPGGSRLTHLMNRAHRGASGGEKEDIARVQHPDAAGLYLSTPFGYETAAPNMKNINDLLQKIETVIQKYLVSPDVPFLLAEFVTEIRPLLSQAIADTQRPLNDVTVGDIGHTGLAFLLTQAVEWILTKRSIDHAELAKKEADNTLLWRVLTIHTDSLRYLEEASLLADLRVRQQQLQATFQKISQQLEETLLAVEIYADEQRRQFLFPNLDQNTAAYQDIQDIVANFSIDGLRLLSYLSDPITNHPDDKNGTYIGDQVLAQLRETPPYDFDAGTIATFWPNQALTKQLCTACNVRPQGYGGKQVKTYQHNPTYYRNKAEGRNICCICMDRRSGIAEKWAKDELNTTVWLDEVADSNGRLALIVGLWKLEDFIQSHFYPHADISQSKIIWLHAVKFLNSSPPDRHAFTINGRIYTWQANQSHLSGEQELAPLKQTNLTIHAPSSMNITVQDVVVTGEQLSLAVQEDLTSAFAVGSQVKCWGQDFRVTGTDLLETVNAAGRQKILSDVLWDTIHPFIVQKATKVNVLEITSPGEGAKNESFARLRRIWQTTQIFWQTALDEKDAEANPILPTVNHRLGIIPQNRDNLDLGHYHTYDLRLTNSVKLSVVWDPENKRFITCDNLDYLAKPELLGKPVIDVLKGELTLEEPSGYGSQNKTWGKITVEQAGELENSGYTPTIPILAEPRTFMALVPADKALAVAQAIKEKYEREMGKVRNRLPLHLGLVYFQRRTPLRAALDAGRRMLDRKRESGGPEDKWQVTAKPEQLDGLPPEAGYLATGSQQFAQYYAVELKRLADNRHLTWYVPAVMGDGQTCDNWYPYVFVETLATAKPADQRSRRFEAPCPWNLDEENKPKSTLLVHAGDLEVDDEIYFTPATFDFEWLDTTGRRFEIAYDETGQRRNRRNRPYLLDELQTLKDAWRIIGGQDGLTNNQIYALRDFIESKRAEWLPASNDASTEKTFKQLCRQAILNAQWPASTQTNGTPDHATLRRLDHLTNWAVSGLLSDTIELYMNVMKEKPERSQTEMEATP